MVGDGEKFSCVGGGLLMLIEESSLPSGGGNFLLETAENAFIPALLNPDTMDVDTG